MFREINQTHNDQGDTNRRWFQEPRMDLFIWTSSNNAIYRFQLIYTASGTERTFEWSLPDTVRNFHSETYGAESAVLNREAEFDAASLLAQFVELSAEMDTDVRTFVTAKLNVECLSALDHDDEPTLTSVDSSLIKLLVLILAAGLLFVWLISALR